MIAPPLIPAFSNLDLAAELDDAVWRELEEFHRAFSVAQHPGEQFLAPDPHAGPRRGDQGLAGEEEAGVHHLELWAARIDARQGGRDVGFLHEAVADDQPVEALAELLEMEGLLLLDIGN